MGHTKDACGVFAEMLERGLQPSSHAYGALINGLIKDHKNKQGSLLSGKNIGGRFCNPDCYLYNAYKSVL